MNFLKTRPALFSRFLILFLIASFTFACKSSDAVKTSNNTSDQTADLEAQYWAQIKKSRMQFVQADVDFMTGMIGHHAQALIMSDLAPKNGANMEVQTLASRIINAQKDEIASMQQWLRDRDQPIPEVHIDGLNLMIHGVGGHHADHMNMAGMLSQEQLNELAAAKGGEFDKLFLTYMIQHHIGALTMVKELISSDGAVQDEEAFKISADINVDQITEIERMRLMLTRLEIQSADL